LLVEVVAEIVEQPLDLPVVVALVVTTIQQ
jgi:hypothetical protein